MKEKIFSNTLDTLKKGKTRLWGISLFGSFVTTLAIILCGPFYILSMAFVILFSTSMMVIYLKKLKGEPISCANLFDIFHDFKTVKRLVLGGAWQFLWVLIWGLIPIAGIYFAIKRSIEYFLTPYILLNQPDVAPTEAIKISKERMKGYKMDVFLCYFYCVAALILVGVILALLGLIPYVGIVFTIILCIVLLCAIVIYPMIFGVLRAQFYMEIENNLNSDNQNNGNNFI